MQKVSLFLPLLIIISLFSSLSSTAQTSPENFYFGNDLSYANMMEDCGADFKEGGISKDVYQIYADNGNNLVRLRLWVDPDWQIEIDQPEGVKERYNDFEDVKEAIQRSKDAGMEVLLDLHYSDFWADPGRQVLPARWYGIGTNVEVLSDSVYAYTYRILSLLKDEGLLPELVQVGNETNPGIMRQRTMDSNYNGQEVISNAWQRHAKLFNAGIKAVRDISSEAESSIQIALHYAGVGADLDWWFNNAKEFGITDFDIIGFSYYYAFHGSSISAVGNQVARLSNAYPDKKVMILETAYPWSSENIDNNPNIVTAPDESYIPLNPENQMRYMVDLTKAVMNGGGDGVVFWESAWVSTPCRTAWNEGSSHDHVAFFDSEEYNFIATGAGGWMEKYIYEDIASLQTIFRVDMTDQDVSNGVNIAADFNGDGEMSIYEMYNEGDNKYALIQYLSPDYEGRFIFLNGTNFSRLERVPEECSNATNTRNFIVKEDSLLYDYIWSSCDIISEQEVELPDVSVTFAVDMTGANTTNGVYITGDFTEDAGGNWSIQRMEDKGNSIYTYHAMVGANSEGGYYFLDGNDWADRESVPSECVGYYSSDRGYFLGTSDTTFAYAWSACTTFELVSTAIEKEDIPSKLKLNQNYPNPFNPSTLITYELSEASKIELTLFNMLGQKVRTLDEGFKSAGTYQIIFSAEGLPSGTYLYRLTSDGFTENRKLMLVK